MQANAPLSPKRQFDLICMVKYHGGVCGYNQSWVVLTLGLPLMGVEAVRPLRACANAWAPDRVWKWTAPAIMVNASMVNAGRAYFRRRIFANLFSFLAKFCEFQNPFKYICNGEINPETVHSAPLAPGVKRNFLRAWLTPRGLGALNGRGAGSNKPPHPVPLPRGERGRLRNAWPALRSRLRMRSRLAATRGRGLG